MDVGQDQTMIHTSQNPQNQNKNDTTITADSGPLFSSQVDTNPSLTCTCTTDGTLCSISPQAKLWNDQLPTQSPNNRVGGNLAMKLSRNAALIGAMVLAPVSGLLGQLQGVPDFVEIACAPKSALASAFEDKGYFIKRVNYAEGYDLDTKKGTSMLKQDLTLHPPRMTWVSLACTRLSPLQNLCQRSEAEWASFEKRQGRDLRRADEVSEGVCKVLENGGDFGWEWPTNATKGWKSHAITRLIRKCRELNRPIYWARFHGCAYGLEYQGVPILKMWTVLTSNKKVWMALQHRCPGHSEHVQCRGPIAQASAYYPQKMVQAIAKAVISSWSEMEDKQDISLGQDVQNYLLQCPCGCPADPYEETARSEDPHILALSRNRFPAEPPTGAKLTAIRQMMLRIHRASGHPSMASLKKMLQMRGAPKWAQTMAENLQCPDCLESKRPHPAPPSSLEETPALFEQVGTDVFEVEYADVKDDGGSTSLKAKFVLWRDRASGLTVVDLLKKFGDDENKHWEPTTSILTKSFSKYLALNPSPKWVISDPASYFTSQEWLDYFGRSGIGVLTAPAEAHWVLGAEEATIGALKATTRRLMKEMPDLDIDEAMHLATHAHNSAIGSSGFSPNQWTRGAAPDDDVPVGLNPSKAFEGLLKRRAKAKVAFEIESAKIRMSRLNNAVGRPSASYRPGALVMLWRQRVKPGKTTGRWVGPLRVLLQEGSTLWLATGAALVKAKLNQVRQLTRREELQSSLEGTAVYRLPVTLETLMKEFTGKHFTDVTGETPSERQLQQDTTPTTVQIEPSSSRPRQDTWRLEEKWLIRVHGIPRLSLFSPGRVGGCPVGEERLTGKRVTYSYATPISAGPPVTITDDFNQSPGKSMRERWTGETHFELKPEHRPKVRRVSVPAGVKRKNKSLPDRDAVSDVEGEGGDDVPSAVATAGGTVFPQVPEALDEALRSRGPDAVDGLPARSSDPSVVGNQCSFPHCRLPGGHEGPHQDENDRKFSWTPYEGKVLLEDDDDSSSYSSSSSEELKADTPEQKEQMFAHAEAFVEEHAMFSLEIDIDFYDAQYLSKHPHKAEVWLSKKMQEKGREAEWKKLTMKQKEQFDEAQSLELSNVLRSKALRSLTKSEMQCLDPKHIMQMRWVLTFKPQDGGGEKAKARLVVLGYQAHNITSVQSAAPTLSRLGRNALMALCSNLKLTLRAGDVTSAFLQADRDLSSENLVIWAPAELAVLFGADPTHPVMPLKIQRAFYGLVHAPRAWHDHVVSTMKGSGWRQLISDRCIFVLQNPSGDIVGIAGLHVDDFLIGGLNGDATFEQAFLSLQGAYRWGKWETGKFTFAGVEVEQFQDKSIKISQEDYSNKWLEEVPLEKSREHQRKSEATREEISLLRGLIGTAAWRASQTSPQFSADTGLLLSELPYATVDTIVRANKLVREMRREAAQSLVFPSWQVDWRELAVVGWADASQKNRADSSSTMGMLIGLAPKGILNGEEHQVALLSWKSSKTPRQVLGSNGAEVQAVTETEDQVFRVRALLIEIFGVCFERGDLDEKVKENTHGAIAWTHVAFLMQPREMFRRCMA